MPKWEYMIWEYAYAGYAQATHPVVKRMDGAEIRDWGEKSFFKAMAEAGEDEWELTGADGHLLFFKRPLAED